MWFKQWLEETVALDDLGKKDAYQKIDLGDDELRQLAQQAYQIERQDRDALTELEIAMHGIDQEIGRRFAAHGMTKGTGVFQLASMIKFLTQGVPDTVYTAPLELRDNERAAGSAMGTAGGTAYRSGHFILVSDLDQPLSAGVKYVIVNMPFSPGVPVLQRKFPNVKFIPYDKVVPFFNSLAKAKTGGAATGQSQQFSLSKFAQELGVRPDSVDVSPSRDGKYIFVRNRATGKSVSVSPAEGLEAAKLKVKSVFGIV